MKKAQIQMGENVIILFIFFILLVFAIVFFTKLQGTKTQQKVSEDVEGRALQIAQRISFLPEVQCTKDNAEIFPGCYDEFSLRGLENLAKSGANNDYYYDLFGFSKVSILILFPPIEPPKDMIVIYDNVKKDYTSIITNHLPISVCNFNFATTQFRKGLCSFAVLKVEVYS